MPVSPTLGLGTCTSQRAALHVHWIVLTAPSRIFPKPPSAQSSSRPHSFRGSFWGTWPAVRARSEVAAADAKATEGQALEVALEIATLEALYGDPSRAVVLRRFDGQINSARDVGEQAVVVQALSLASLGRPEEAKSLTNSFQSALPEAPWRWRPSGSLSVQRWPFQRRFGS